MNKLSSNTIYVVVTISIILALGSFATDIYVPALPLMKLEYNTHIELVQASLSAFFMTLGITQLLAGPFIQTLGLYKTTRFSLYLYMIACLLCFFATNLTYLIIARIFQGFASGLLAVIGKSYITTYYDKETAAKLFLYILPIVILSPGIAPIIGSIVTIYISWKTTFLVSFLFGVIAFILGTKLPMAASDVEQKQNTLNTIVESYLSVLKNKLFLGYVGITSATYIIYFTYIAQTPFIFHANNYSIAFIGKAYLPLAIFYLIGSRLTRKLMITYNLQYIIRVLLLILFLATVVFIIF
ncbi:MAG: MFS transporter, partial [Sediminibacterium sp.]